MRNRIVQFLYWARVTSAVNDDRRWAEEIKDSTLDCLALATSKAFHYALLNEAIVAAIAAIGRTTDRHDDRVAS